MPAYRVWRADGLWSAMRVDAESSGTISDVPYDMLPADVQPNLSVLLVSPLGFIDPQVGRRISEDVFWVYGGCYGNK